MGGEPPLQLDFREGGVSVSNACNRISATVALDDDRLDVGDAVSTMMACTDERLGRLEREIGQRLPGTHRIAIRAGDTDLAGDWFGYDGPYPPPNDLRTHRYFFRLFALDVARLELPARFTAGDVLRAIQGHVLAEASVWGTYALHPKARPA